MTAVAIRKKLVSYLNVAEEQKVKAIYALVEDDIEQENYINVNNTIKNLPRQSLLKKIILAMQI